jgi:hypothetical protein
MEVVYDRTTLEMRSLSLKIIWGGFSAKREYTNTTHISIQYQYYEVKVKIIIDYFDVLELQEVNLQRILQKISQSLSRSKYFCGSVQLDIIRVITSP